MTALASIGPIGWVSIVGGSWLALGITVAPRIGRLFRANDPGEHEPDHPPLPSTLRVVTEDDYDADLPAWLFDVPSQPLSQDEFDRSEAILRGVA